MCKATKDNRIVFSEYLYLDETSSTLVPRIGEYLRVGTYKNLFSNVPDTTKLVVVSCVIYDYPKGVVSVYLEDKE